MIFRAIKMLRSFRSSEFNGDDEKDVCRSDNSINESSPEAIAIHHSTIDGPRVDKINNSDVLQPSFNSNIQPRASIRTKDLQIMDVNSKSTPKMSEESVNRQTYPVLASENTNNSDDVIIIKEISKQNEMSGNKSALQNPKSKYCKNNLLHIYDDLPNPLVIDLDDVSAAEEECTSDSQSTCYSFPQEMYDLCGNEIKICKANKLGQNKGNKKQFHKFKKFSKAVTEEKADLPQASNISLQTKLQYTITSNNLLKSSENIMGKVKNVKDGILRLKLPLKGTKKKKLFIVKTSKLIDLVQRKHHPLHKWQHLLTLENINDLHQGEKIKLIKILADFIEVKVVKTRREYLAA